MALLYQSRVGAPPPDLQAWHAGNAERRRLRETPVTTIRKTNTYETKTCNSTWQKDFALEVGA